LMASFMCIIQRRWHGTTVFIMKMTRYKGIPLDKLMDNDV